MGSSISIGGYADANFTFGSPLGVTVGALFTNNGYFVYGGPAINLSPPVGVSLTYGSGTASSGLAGGVQGTIFPYSGRVGYQIGSGRFSEFGGGAPSGFSVSGFYVFGPYGRF